MSDILRVAVNTIVEEAQALEILSKNIPEMFEDAINAIFESPGRLAVSGIGKSGHIGRKISSTMASLGQRSFFIHPSEAHHGDLGMLAQQDIILMISYSGEAIELVPIIEFAKRFGMKTISISRDKNSTLAKNSDIPLILPNIKEACPLGIAPTVSSTMTLALGDAMASALLMKRGFTREKFKELHPGGALGKSLSFVFEIMRPAPETPVISINSLMKDAVIAISKYGLGCVGVIEDDGGLAGIITDGDLRRNMDKDLLSMDSRIIMTQFPISIDKMATASEALFIMEDKRITNMFVVDEKHRPIGIVHIHDILKSKLM